MAKLKCAACGRAFVGDGRRRYCDEHQPPKRVRNRARAQHLHAIGPNDVPPQTPRPKTIAEAAEKGSTLDELRLMRMRIARALDDPNCPPRDLAALSRRQIELGKEIDAIEARNREEGAVSDGGVEDGEFDASAV
ncbi:hypothetical protein J2X03_003793 [Microbacterium trichothecenolyticum]|uniref:hypothetical protein n=1 Tax=Microbacterium trichothecenolyticum TaxID=69370 RepID=UPI00285591F2|nr:hypothetical protein [Microbacterium trichothecenolyticum]MDR7113891.1 hypothetical protein [Microbacterium trichothecenolyticum]